MLKVKEIKIKDIKVNEFNLVAEIKNKSNKSFQKCLDLLSNKSELMDLSLNDIKKLLPKKSKITVSFEMLNTNVSIANGIRRCLSDEMEVQSFDFDEYKDLITDDPFILCDFIKKQIELLPISQEMNLDGIDIKLFKENKTDEIIDVTSDDFIIESNADKKNKTNFKQKDLEEIVEGNIVLCRLRPNNYIKINNIFISKGIAKHDAAKYSLLSNITYKILDVDPIVETRTGQTGVSSMLSDPKHFFLSYTTHRNIEYPQKLMIKCCDTLISRLENILTDMKNVSNSDTIYMSGVLTLESSGNLKKIHIINEYWTIINMISQYCYILTKKNIKFVAPSIIHPEKEVGVISIIHPEFSTLIQNSIKAIIADLNIVKKYFKE